MTIKKIENGPRLLKATSSAVSPGSNRGKEPQMINDVQNTHAGEDQMDGSPGTSFDARTTMDNLTKTTEEIASFSQGNVDAIMKAGQVWAAGCQAISKTMAATTQAHLDQTMSTWKALTSVKSLREAMDLRASLRRTSFEAAFAETGKLADASMKLAEETMGPITERILLAVEKFKHTAN